MNNEALAHLITVYGLWCEQEGLECTSADEMRVRDKGQLTARQREWLEAFSNLWDLTI